MKQITLSKNSNHYKLFKKITGFDPPMSLCPYFWIWVSIIVFSPLILVYKSIKFLNLKVRRNHEELMDVETILLKEKRKLRWNKIGKYTERGFYCVVIIVAIGIFVSGVINFIETPFNWKEFKESMVIILKALCAGFILTFVVFTFSWVLSKITKPNNFIYKICDKIWGYIMIPLGYIGKFLTIIGEVIYSKYKKVCPIIKWK